MFKIDIENLKYEVQHTVYFEKREEVSAYIKECYPYEKRNFNFEGNFESSSFIIHNEGSPVCSINVYRGKFHSKNNRRAWDGERTNIAEIFDFPFVYDLEKEFYKWLTKIDEDNVDSYRIGLLNDSQSMRDFNDLYSCCGSKEETIEFNGVKFIFGCNFGH